MSTKRVGVVSDHMKEYGPEYTGKSKKGPLERGQVFHLNNQLNDEKLIGWKYVKELEEGEETYTCKCGREFMGGPTDPAMKAHGIKWNGGCTAAVDLDEGVQVKSGRKPRLQGGGDPDGEGPGWDVGVGETDGPPQDPYAGVRDATGKERPKRLSVTR